MLSILAPRSKSSSSRLRNDSSNIPISTNSSSSVATVAAPHAKVVFLNQSLETLLDVFPGGDVEKFRQLLLTTADESCLYVVTEILLKSYKDTGPGLRTGRLEPWEKFRSEEYKATVKKMLCKEFRALSKSTVQTVMLEHNFAYSPSRATLAHISSKSWRASFSNFFRKSSGAPAAELFAGIASTGCKELDEELFEFGRDKREEQINSDKILAEKINEDEYAATEELIECECCYGDYAWEQISACTEGHFFCRNCLIRTVQESVYGQGRNVLSDKCLIKCLSSSAQPPCDASVLPEVLRASLPEDIHQALDDRASSENLEKTGLQLVRCPFCGYAEVDEFQSLQFKRVFLIWFIASTICLSIISTESFLGRISLQAIFLISAPFFLFTSWRSTLKSLSLYQNIERTARKVHLQRRGTRFRCAAPRCERQSCITCNKEWGPFHKCYEKEEDAARIYVEKAMADAVKRTCPLCNVSFVKSDGCNKLTCPCGYIMCYICRADIRKTGYKHFCQHFRQIPGTACQECDSCDLYATEDEAAAISKAAKEAEAAYWRRHSRPSGWDGRHIKGAPADVRKTETMDEVFEKFEGFMEKVFDLILV